MLIIRREQIAVLTEALWSQFIGRLIGALRRGHPQWVESLSDEELQARVRRDVARARDCGLTWQSSLARFVELSLLLGPDFDQQPIVAAGLRRGGGSADERLERMMREMNGAQWGAVAAAGRR
jgi:hypothetical protein